MTEPTARDLEIADRISSFVPYSYTLVQKIARALAAERARVLTLDPDWLASVLWDASEKATPSVYPIVPWNEADKANQREFRLMADMVLAALSARAEGA